MEDSSTSAAIVIRLNKDEIDAINAKMSGQGGFQNLFKQLKEQTHGGVLTVTPELCSMIVRYSEKYGAGGYQRRLKKLNRLTSLVGAARRMESAGDYLPDLLGASEDEIEYATGNIDTAIEDNLTEDSEEDVPLHYSITSYGADYDVDGLVKRIRSEAIYIPSFQRKFVWTRRQASRFIESLLLGLPVPGVFLSKEAESNRLLVIDGQQRLRSLMNFYEGIWGKRRFALSGISSRFNGIAYSELTDDDRRLLDDSIIHATVVKQDEPTDDQSSIYHVFERINTGGTPLSSQEIRKCIYHGEFMDLLRELNRNEDWRCLFGPTNARMRDEELILRFLAFYYEASDYKRPMKGFLNTFAGGNRRLIKHAAAEITEVFETTVRLVRTHLGVGAFKPFKVLNAAVLDAVMVGLARRISKGAIEQPNQLARRYALLLDDDDFLSATDTSTADEDNVARRIRAATGAFDDAL